MRDNSNSEKNMKRLAELVTATQQPAKFRLCSIWPLIVYKATRSWLSTLYQARNGRGPAVMLLLLLLVHAKHSSVSMLTLISKTLPADQWGLVWVKLQIFDSPV